MKKQPVLVAALLPIFGFAASLGAADYFFPHFLPFHDSTPLPMPPACARVGGLLGPASSSLDDDGVMTLTYTCADGSVILRADMRPGSGTAVGSPSANIKLNLDAPSGTTSDRFVNGGGWAFECGHALPEADVMIDGVRQPANRWARPDVAVAFGNTCPTEMQSSGIGFQIDTAALAAGSHTVQLFVADDTGHTATSNALQLNVVR